MSLIVLPSGKCATFEAALEGTGMTSEQSTSSYTLFPSVDIFAIACVKRSTMSFWLAVMRITSSAGDFGRGEMGVRRLTDEGLPLASRARVPGIECERRSSVSQNAWTTHLAIRSSDARRNSPRMGDLASPTLAVVSLPLKAVPLRRV